jgi:hypothetical protein
MQGTRSLASIAADGTRPQPLLMSMRDIAELAGVRRPVVTMWRRRYPDFPVPADGDVSQLLFDPRQIADWLIATGRADRDTIVPDLSLYTIAGLVDRSRPSDVIAITTALICLRHLDEDEPLADGRDDVVAALHGRAAKMDPGDELLLSEIRMMPTGSGWLAVAVDDLVEAAWGCCGAFERIMGARHRFGAAEIFTCSVRPELARLIARVCGAAESARRDGVIVVADVSAGPGDLLAAVVDLLGDDYTPMCIAAEPDPYLARLVRRRLAVHGLPPVDVDVHTVSALPDTCGEPDVIVTQIPYTPGEDRSAKMVLDVMDDVSLRLRPGRSAVVLGPADILTGDLPPYSEAERMRAALLKDGMVESVIKLPGGLVPFRPGYETALWVLNSARESPWRGRVLLADVSDTELTDEVADALADDVITWRRDGYEPDAHTRAFGTQVLVGDLVEPPKPLVVRRPRSILTAGVDAAGQLALAFDLEKELDRLGAYATAVRRPIRTNLIADIRARPAVMSIGKLAEGRQRALSVLKGTRIGPSDITGAGQHAVLGSDEVLGLRVPGGRTLDRAVLAERYPRAELTEPGDVLLTAVPGFGVLVDHEGFSVAEFPVRVLRIRDAGRTRLTPRVLAAMLAADDSPSRPDGAIRAARRIEDHQVPLLAAEDVKRLDILLAELDARRSHARQEIDALDELAKTAMVGLRNGTLTLVGDTT